MNKSIAAAAVLAVALSGSTALASADAATAHHHAAPHAAQHAKAGRYQVTAKASDTEPLQGTKVTIRGKVSPAAPGAPVTLQVKYQGEKTWKTIAHKLLRSNGKVTFQDKVTSVRERTYRVVKPTDARRKGGSGDTEKVVVYGWRNLSSLDRVSGSTMSSGNTVTMNGTEYPESLAGNASSPTSVSYNLNRDCKQLDAVYGVTDNSQSNGSATLTVTADNVVKHNAPYALTQAQRVVTDVTGVFRLSIAGSPIGGIPAVGTPKVLCSF